MFFLQGCSNLSVWRGVPETLSQDPSEPAARRQSVERGTPGHAWTDSKRMVQWLFYTFDILEFDVCFYGESTYPHQKSGFNKALLRETHG